MAREERTEMREKLEVIVPDVIEKKSYDFPNSITVLQGAISNKVVKSY